MHVIVSLLLCQSTPDAAVRQLIESLELRDLSGVRRLIAEPPGDEHELEARMNDWIRCGARRVLRECPAIGTPAEAVHEMELSYRIAGKDIEQRIKLVLRRFEGSWKFRDVDIRWGVYENHAPARHPTVGGSPSEILRHALQAIEKREFSDLAQFIALDKLDARMMEERIRKEDERCEGKLTETLRQLPAIECSENDVIEIQLTAWTQTTEAAVSFLRTREGWKIVDFEVDLI